MGLAVAWAQTAQIAGTITDPTGAAIPAAGIIVTRRETGLERKTTSNAKGRYAVPLLPPGRYRVSAQHDNFVPVAHSGIILSADQNVRLDFSLEVGPVTEQITVEGDVSQVDVVTATLRQVIERRRLVDLPLEGRNAAELTLLVAGAYEAPAAGTIRDGTVQFPGSLAISASGARQNQISYNLDGGVHHDTLTQVNAPFPMPDALQEFSIQTGNYSAEFGSNAGAVVNVVSKSGTNEFHGNVFAFHRNEVFNARNVFAAERDPLKRTQFGGTFGGPVHIPGLYRGRDKTFFFLGYQGTRTRTQDNALNAIVPTDANRQGDFSSSPQAVTDPLTGAPFPGNLIPLSRRDPVSVELLSFLPPGGANGLVFVPQPSSRDFNEILLRGDHQFGSSDTLFIRHFLDDFVDRSNWDGRNFLLFTNSAEDRVQQLQLRETHIFSHQLINDFSFGFSRYITNRDGPPDAPNAVDLGARMYNPEGLSGVRTIVSGFFATLASDRLTLLRRNFSLSNSVKWISGRHNMSFGGRYQRSLLDQKTQFLAGGQWIFLGLTTRSPLASFLLGQPWRFQQNAAGIKSNVVNIPSLYFQDNFRVSRRLSLTFGLRWDPLLPLQERGAKFHVFDPDRFRAGETSRQFVNAPPGLFFRGDAGIPEHGHRADWNNLAPRVGFAYDLSGDGKTSLRGGAGVFYNQRVPLQQQGGVFQSAPWGATLRMNQPEAPFSDPFREATNPFPLSTAPVVDALFPSPTVVAGYDPKKKFVTPIIYHWHLTLERQLSSDYLLRTAYVASHGSHLMGRGLELNPADNTILTGRVDARRLFPGYSSIGMQSSSKNSSYHSLQATLEKRFSRGPAWLDGLSLLTNYTWSHSIDDQAFNEAENGLLARNVAPLPFNHPFLRPYNRGPSDFDRRHRFVASYVWDLPGPPTSGVVGSLLLGGWELTGILSVQTGAPFTVLAGADSMRTGLSSQRAVVLEGVDPYQSGPGKCAGFSFCEPFLSPAAFALPAVNTFAAQGKNVFRGPRQWTWDMGFFKNFRHEEFNVQLRWEFFNIFNNARLNLPSFVFRDPRFGAFTQAKDPRIGQVGLKISF